MPIPVIIFSRDQAIVRNIDWKSVLKAKNITFWNFFLQTKSVYTNYTDPWTAMILIMG